MAIVHRRHSDQRAQRQRRHKEPTGHSDNDDDTTDEEDDEEGDTNAERLAGAQITPDMFLEMCPLLLLQLDQRACADGVSARRLEDSMMAPLFGMRKIN